MRSARTRLLAVLLALSGAAACDQLNRPFNTTSSSSSGAPTLPSAESDGGGGDTEGGVAPTFAPQPGDIQL